MHITALFVRGFAFGLELDAFLNFAVLSYRLALVLLASQFCSPLHTTSFFHVITLLLFCTCTTALCFGAADVLSQRLDLLAFRGSFLPARICSVITFTWWQLVCLPFTPGSLTPWLHSFD